MRTLSFLVNGQQLIRDPECNFDGLVKGTQGYLKVKIRFSDDWEGCRKAVSFMSDKEYAIMLDKDNTCMIPDEVLTGNVFEMSVVGVKENYKITSGKVRVKQND